VQRKISHSRPHTLLSEPATSGCSILYRLALPLGARFVGYSLDPQSPKAYPSVRRSLGEIPRCTREEPRGQAGPGGGIVSTFEQTWLNRGDKHAGRNVQPWHCKGECPCQTT